MYVQFTVDGGKLENFDAQRAEDHKEYARPACNDFGRNRVLLFDTQRRGCATRQTALKFWRFSTPPPPRNPNSDGT